MGARLNIKFTNDSGALLALDPPGMSRQLESRLSIVAYMREHIDNWLALANKGWGLDLKEQDLIFVSGTMKTKRWMVTAYKGITECQEGAASLECGGSASAKFSISLSNQILPGTHYRIGPHQQSYGATASGSPSSEVVQSGEQDQCIFIHYYKMRKRLWRLREPMRAAAGPHDLPHGPRDPDAVEGMVVDDDDLSEDHPECTTVELVSTTNLVSVNTYRSSYPVAL